MDLYEQKYKEAIERAKVRRGMAAISKDDLEFIFPELAESEDEKIRKELLRFVECSIHDEQSEQRKAYIAWLEKQGEQKKYTFKSIPRLLDMIEPSDKAKAYCQKLIDTLTNEGYNADAKIVGEVLNGWNGEDVPMAVMDEQKHAWSGEDERLCSCLIEEQEESLDKVKNDKYGHSEIISDLKEMYRERIDWLKSLKERLNN